MNERKLQRREFIRLGVLGAGGLAAGAAALWVLGREEAPAPSDSPTPTTEAGATLRPWLGFVAADARDGEVVPASAARGAISARAVHLQVSGQVPEAAPGGVDTLRRIAVDVLFGAAAEFPFHAWSASLAPSRSVSPSVGCRVPVLPRGLALRLTLDAGTPASHDLVLGGGGAAAAAPLAPGHYFVALAERAPRWSDFRRHAETGALARLQRTDGSSPRFACVGVTVTPA